MDLKIEKYSERNVSSTWILIKDWKIQGKTVDVCELKISYNNEFYTIIYPKNYFEKKSPLCAKNDLTGKCKDYKLMTESLKNIQSNFNDLEEIIKKIR
jgi:hypothetical protein